MGVAGGGLGRSVAKQRSDDWESKPRIHADARYGMSQVVEPHAKPRSAAHRSPRSVKVTKMLVSVSGDYIGADPRNSGEHRQGRRVEFDHLVPCLCYLAGAERRAPNRRTPI